MKDKHYPTALSLISRVFLFFPVMFLLNFPAASLYAQSPVEFSLGKGAKAVYTPPSGWTKGTGYDNEQCWNAPGSVARICLKTTWKQGRTADEILKNEIAGLNWFNAQDKQFEIDQLRTVWKECQVKVGPRTEGRLWSVTDFKQAPNVMSIEVLFIQPANAIHQAVLKSLEEMKYFGAE